jgi:hypothetical protein
VLRQALAAGVVEVSESDVHAVEAAPRPELGLLELLRELSGGRRLAPGPDAVQIERRLQRAIEKELPERQRRAGDALDLRALATALPACRLVTCDAFMADVVRRTRLDRRYGCELFTGRRDDVRRLRARLLELLP